MHAMRLHVSTWGCAIYPSCMSAPLTGSAAWHCIQLNMLRYVHVGAKHYREPS